VVAMLLELLNAPAGAGGSVSAGGTESNMMAVKTARDWARVHRPDAQPLCARMGETVPPSEITVEGGKGYSHGSAG
jgi:glutamate/tyrosine decarboxylase-like PLP-dependent enzyme